MKATDIQHALDNLATNIRDAMIRYLDETEHTHTPTISIEFVITHSIGESQYSPTVTVQGAMTAQK